MNHRNRSGGPGATSRPVFYQIIGNAGAPTRVLGVFDDNPLPFAKVTAARMTLGGDVQQWSVGDDGVITCRSTGLVLTVLRGVKGPLLPVICYPRQQAPAPHQTWTITEAGEIRSGVDGLVLDLIVGPVEPQVCAAPPNGSPTQRWIRTPLYTIRNILSMHPVGFPEFIGDEQQAFLYISESLGYHDNLRRAYTNLGESLSALASSLAALRRPSSIGEAAWGAVVEQLLREITGAEDVRALFTQFSEFYGDLFQDEGERLSALVSASEVDPAASASGWAMDLFLGVTRAVLSANPDWLPGVEAWGGPAGNLITAAVSTALALGTASPEPFHVDVSKLWNTLSEQFESVLDASGRNETTILEDWGKMQAVVAAIRAEGPGSLRWDPRLTGKLVEAAIPGYIASALKMVLPASYSVEVRSQWTYDTMPGLDPAQYRATPAGNGTWNIDTLVYGTRVPRADFMREYVWKSGISPTALYTNRHEWPFPEAVEGNTSLFDRFGLLTRILNVSGNGLTITATAIEGEVNGHATARVGGWAERVTWFSKGTLWLHNRVRFDVADASGRTVASFDTYREGQLDPAMLVRTIADGYRVLVPQFESAGATAPSVIDVTIEQSSP